MITIILFEKFSSETFITSIKAIYMTTHSSKSYKLRNIHNKKWTTWNAAIQKGNNQGKSMQRSGTEATRTQLQPSKPKREITYITNSQNTKRTYGQPSEQLFPKRWPLSNRNRTKNNMNKRKAKRHRNSDPKQVTDDHNKTTALERSVMNYCGLKVVLRRQPHPQFLNWYKTFSR